MTDASKRGRAARAKGQRGERQVAAAIHALTGWDVRRRVRNHSGDSDLTGVPNWSLEIKDRAGATLGDLRSWWQQTVQQAGDLQPVLIYKRQPGEWRAVRAGWLMGGGPWRLDFDHTVESSLEAWVVVARELAAGKALEAAA